MKIVFVCPTSVHRPYNNNSLTEFGMGASWSSVIWLSRELWKRGHEVVVLNHSPAKLMSGMVLYPCADLMRDASNKETRDLVKDVDVCVINRAGNATWHDFLTKECGVSKKYKKILWCHDSGGAEIGQEVFKEYDKIVSVSEWLNDINIRANANIPEERFAAIPLGVDATVFSPAEPETSPLYICFLGALVRARRPFLAIDVFAEVRRQRKDVKLLMIGGADIWDYKAKEADPVVRAEISRGLSRLAKEASNDVIFLGSIPTMGSGTSENRKLGVCNILPLTTVMVYPSYTETCGVSIIEAQMSGVPTVAALDGMRTAIKERVIPNQTGIVGDFRDIKSVANTVLALLEKKSLYQQIRKQGLDYAQSKNSWAVIGDRWNNLIEGL